MVVVDLADAGILFPAEPAGILFPAEPAGILFPADPAGTATADVAFLADAEEVTVGVAELADAEIVFPTDPAGILFPADPAGILFPAEAAGILFPADTARTDPVDVAFLADAEEVTVGVAKLTDAGILFPTDTAGILFPTDTAGTLFPADPAGTVAADVAFLADADPVTIGVTGLADVGAVPLAVTDITFPEVGLVCMDVVNEVDVTPGKCGDDYGSLHGDGIDGYVMSRKVFNSCSAVLFEMVTVGTVGFARDRQEVFRNSISDLACLVVPEIRGWQRCEAFGNNRYVHYEDIDGRSESSDYDDPRDYREWDDWSDLEDTAGYYDIFPGKVEDDSIVPALDSILGELGSASGS